MQQLLDEDQCVRVLEHPDAAVDHLPLDRIELIRADIRDETAVMESTRECRYVYHLAADPNLWRRDRREFEAVNNIGTVNVMRAALDNGAERVLHTTTESILTTWDSNGGAVEDLRLKESDMLGPYCLSKFHAEEAVFQMVDDGAPVVIVCPTVPVGPGDRRQTPPTRMSVAFCRGELPGYLDCRLNLVDIRDVAAGMIVAMRRGRTGVRYLLGGENQWLSEWLRILGDETGQPVPQWRVPYALALTFAWFSERWADHVSGSMPLATVTGVRLTRRCMFFDSAASLIELGLESRPITESARDAVVWYREQGWL